MFRCCLEDGAPTGFGVDPAPVSSCVGGLEVTGKEAAERGVPGMEDGRGIVAAVAGGGSIAGADADAASDEACRWGAEK